MNLRILKIKNSMDDYIVDDESYHFTRLTNYDEELSYNAFSIRNYLPIHNENKMKFLENNGYLYCIDHYLINVEFKIVGDKNYKHLLKRFNVLHREYMLKGILDGN